MSAPHQLRLRSHERSVDTMVDGHVRAPWGVVLLCAPGTVLALSGREAAAPRPALAVLRLLGLRHLVQAAVEWRRPSARVLAAAAVVDGIHAGTAVAFAALDRRWRRAALLDAAVATGFCLATARSARGAR